MSLYSWNTADMSIKHQSSNQSEGQIRRGPADEHCTQVYFCDDCLYCSLKDINLTWGHFEKWLNNISQKLKTWLKQNSTRIIIWWSHTRLLFLCGSESYDHHHRINFNIKTYCGKYFQNNSSESYELPFIWKQTWLEVLWTAKYLILCQPKFEFVHDWWA